MKVIIIIIIFLGGFLRFYNLNWDSFGAFHPDERNISWAVTRIHFFDQMNPKFFAYGGLPIYLYRAIGEGVVKITSDREWLMDWGHIAVIGRHVSATLSTISIFLIFLVARSYFSSAIGYLSAFLLAFSPWAIREAHFQTTETMLVFFLLLLLAMAKHITKKHMIALGIIWGLSMAAKTTGLLFGVIPMTAIIFTRDVKKISKKILCTIILFSTAFLIFFLFSPYTILDWQHFRESMTYESGVAIGRFTVPYTLQFVKTPVYVYQIMTMLWQAGPLVIVGLAGLLVLCIRTLFTKHYSLFTFLVFPLLYFGWVGGWFAKFSRYNVPFLPFLTITAAWFCVFFIKKFRVTGLAIAAILLATTSLWGLSNFSIYLRPQTKIEATKWIFEHIEENAAIYTEHWNDGLPLALPGITSVKYNRELLTVYDDDNQTKIEYYMDKLPKGDYIILSTRRISGTMPKLKEKYPITSVFYTKLLSGDLGYKEVATFTSYPQLFGFEINDETAEESFQVFDHPTVRIFKNTERLPAEEINSLLMSSMGS